MQQKWETEFCSCFKKKKFTVNVVSAKFSAFWVCMSLLNLIDVNAVTRRGNPTKVRTVAILFELKNILDSAHFGQNWPKLYFLLSTRILWRGFDCSNVKSEDNKPNGPLEKKNRENSEDSESIKRLDPRVRHLILYRNSQWCR